MQQRIEDQQRRAAADRHVCDVEGRVVPLLPVEVQEVDDVPVEQPVDHVADRATEQQRESGDEPGLAARRQRAQPPCDAGADDGRQSDEEPALPAARTGQQAEGRTGVMQSRELEHRQQHAIS